MAANRLYGIGEPVTMRALNGDLDAMKALDIMADIGVKAFREWMHIPMILENPTTPKPEVVAAFTRTLDRCKELDIEVTGMSHCWFLPEDAPQEEGFGKGMSMPYPDHTPGSLYMRTLEMLEQSWYTMVSCFPQVPLWETGNEFNAGFFLHPIGWKPGKPGENPGMEGEGFTFRERHIIICDMMYYSARGIRRANPDAKVVSNSPTPAMPHRSPFPHQYAIALSLEEMYQVIEAGESFSTDSDDYFDMVAWHPYLGTQMGYSPVFADYPAKEDYYPDELPDARWRSFSDCAYAVMARHGDGHKKVLITEFGFSDAGDPEREKFQAQLIRDTFEECRKMPYLYTMHFFRLFEQELKGESGNAPFRNQQEAKFGIVREPEHNYEYRTKAKVLKEIYTK